MPGATGPRGPAGQIELVNCKTVTKIVKRRGKKLKLTHQQCTTRLVSGTVKFTTATARASIARGRTVYATGASVSMGRGRAALVLTDVRALHRGRYTLTLTRRLGHRQITTRRQITIV